MALSSFHCIAIFLFVLANVVMFGNAKDLGVTFKEAACNGRTIPPAGDFSRAVSDGLNKTVEKKPEEGYNFYVVGKYMHATAFTHGQCIGDLDRDDCGKCEVVAKGKLIQSCAFHKECWVELNDCYIGWWEFPNK